MTAAFLLFLFVPAVAVYYSPPVSSRCIPCAVPTTVVLPAAHSPCYHPGQPIFDWPSGNCPTADEVKSEEFSVEDGIVFAKHRICFHEDFDSFEVEVRCQGLTKKEGLRIGRNVKKRRRQKRWLRRRNPNGNAVHFQQETYVREMAEDTAVGSLVTKVHATHANGQPIFYSMVAPQDSRSQNIFSLDTVTGEIRLAKALDREVLGQHVLRVTAFERTDAAVSGTCTVVVDVLDVQDNSPVFERDAYFADIREDAPIGTTVLSVFARDLDAGANGDVEYLLSENEGAHYLTINSKSGVIQTAAALDRETVPLIRLDVIARDHGDPPRQSSALIEIGIVDVNDNAPVFEQDSYNISVLENITVPAVVATVKATDKDAGINGKVHYSLVSSSNTSPLMIDYATGAVTLRERVHPKSTPLAISVRAKDGAQPAMSSTVTLTLHVIDINDHAPRFFAVPKHLFLEENAAVGEDVGKIYAIDDDAGENGMVQYSIEGSDDFVIDPISGKIKTAKLLDRERTSHYELTVIASDQGTPPQTNSTVINVIIKDVNDNPPMFEAAEYNVTLSEETEIGAHILTAKAVDKDEKQKISYNIEHSDRDVVTLMDMGDLGALLTLSRPLHSSDRHIKLEISATDQGGLQGRCTVNLFVDDVNSPPYFLDVPEHVEVAENAAIGFPVVTLRAADSDVGSNAAVKFSLEDESGLFKIDPSTGLITLAGILDREKRVSHSLLAIASDSAEPPLNATASIEVVVVDVNDNAPKFTSSLYEASIAEDIAVGTSFLQVSAIDDDAGSNGVVDYYLDENDIMVALDLFRLDRTSGTLRVNAPLDREKYSNLDLPVIARDRGRPSLSAKSKIRITLLDVNDNAPRFSQPSYDLYIAENSPAGSVVGTIAATDPDEGENARIEFRIFGGNDAKLFDIEQDGGTVRVLSRASFDYEAKTNTYHIEIQASSGQLRSTASIRIHVSDVNDNKPILKDFTLLLTQFDDEALSGHIGMIPAFDPDQNATLEYSMENNDIINVDKFTGKLSLIHHWKRTFEAKFRTCVSDGPNTVCAICQLIHTHVPLEWLRSAVTTSLFGLQLDDFWDPATFNRFRQSIASLDDWEPSNVHVLTAQKAEQGVQVSIVVMHKDKLVRPWKLVDRISGDVAGLERMSLIRITVVDDDSCSREPCPYHQKCRQTLKYVDTAQTYQTDNFVARFLNTLNTFVCECPTGFSSSIELPGQCDRRTDQCYSSPCKHNGTCRPLENGYFCECVDGWRGSNCEIPETALTCLPDFCKSGSSCRLHGGTMKCHQCPYELGESDQRCRLLSLSFGGSGIANINRQLSRLSWSLELRIATIAHDGVILFSGDKKTDFLELSIQERTLKVEFSLGDGIKAVSMDQDRENRINDGEWHTVRLQYNERELTLLLDDCDPFIAMNAPGSKPCAARGKIELPKKCRDPTVPCSRHLDLSNGIFLGARPAPNRNFENGFNGCLANLTLDGLLIDYDFDELDRVGTVEPGCSARRHHCQAAGCAPAAHCINRWAGRNCRCAHSVHSTTCRSTTARALTLTEDESFVLFETPAVVVPLDFAFEFRTSRADSQVLAVEFDQANKFFKLQIEDGLIRASAGAASVLIPSPEFEPGSWTRADVVFDDDSVDITIDGIYTASINVPLVGATLSSVYSGLAPSTAHPSRFDGCLRDISVDGTSLEIKEKGKVRPGCVASNRCSMDEVCPKESKCHRKFDRHECVCHKGFAGDICQPVCTIKGICGREGFCQQTNATYGYSCQCPPGTIGRNCEISAPLSVCPDGYWGEFPHCQKCDCSSDPLFLSQCDRKDGSCVCQRGYFYKEGRCTACECGIGAASADCDASGQCVCTGQATGRRCDRCAEKGKALDAKTLKCLSAPGSCASEIEGGIQWPTTRRGETARSSCRGGESGLATRLCGKELRWYSPNTWNCTKAEFGIMVNKFDALDSSELLALLSNATSSTTFISGRNLEIARSAVFRIIQNEMNSTPSSRAHLRDGSFTSCLVEVIDKLLLNEEPSEYLNVVKAIYNYGQAVYEGHQRAKFLQPFAVTTEDMLFAYDNLDFSNDLPKFNNFLDQRRKARRPRIHLEQSTSALYFIAENPRCARCDGAIVASISHSSVPTRITFPLDISGWKYPECVRLHEDGVWTANDATLVGLNLTHATCEFAKDGVFALFVKGDRAAYLHISSSDGLASPALAGASLVLCLMSLVGTLLRREIRTRLVRVGFIVFFIFNAMSIFVVHKLAVNQTFCPARNAVLSFSTSAPFAWLFLYALHIYRMLADGNANSSVTVCLLVGLVLPCLLGSASLLFASQCTLLPSGWLFWMIVIPVGMFLLLSFYASATSLLVSMSKQFDVIVVKFNLRKALFQHFVLTSLALVHLTLGLFLPLLAISTPIQELVCNISLLVTSIFIVVWSFCPAGSLQKQQSLWLEPSKLPEQHIPEATSPLLPPESVTDEWIPDVIPADPYLNSPPRRPDQLPTTILSPAEKILSDGLGHVYGNFGTLPRLRTDGDDADDAYYTYTAQRRQKNSTFNR